DPERRRRSGSAGARRPRCARRATCPARPIPLPGGPGSCARRRMLPALRARTTPAPRARRLASAARSSRGSPRWSGTGDEPATDHVDRLELDAGGADGGDAAAGRRRSLELDAVGHGSLQVAALQVAALHVAALHVAALHVVALEVAALHAAALLVGAVAVDA